MQKNILKSGIEISELGLGCMSLGTEYANLEPIIEKAIESGITYFDTAIFMIEGLMKNCGQSFKNIKIVMIL